MGERQGQSGQAIKLFQITPYVNDFPKHWNGYRENLFTKVPPDIYR